MARFNPFPKVNCAYGAPMGRLNTNPANFYGYSIDEYVTSRPQGEYDSGGAYWGYSQESPVYAVWIRGKGPELGVIYVRAHTPEQAKLNVLTLTGNR